MWWREFQEQSCEISTNFAPQILSDFVTKKNLPFSQWPVQYIPSPPWEVLLSGQYLTIFQIFNSIFQTFNSMSVDWTKQGWSTHLFIFATNTNTANPTDSKREKSLFSFSPFCLMQITQLEHKIFPKAKCPTNFKGRGSYKAVAQGLSVCYHKSHKGVSESLTFVTNSYIKAFQKVSWILQKPVICCSLYISSRKVGHWYADRRP